MSAMKSLVNWLGLGPDEGEPYAGHLSGPHRGVAGPEHYGALPSERYPAAIEPMSVADPAPLMAGETCTGARHYRPGGPPGAGATSLVTHSGPPDRRLAGELR